MCYEQNVYITEEIAEKLTPDKELESLSADERTEQLLKTAKL